MFGYLFVIVLLTVHDIFSFFFLDGIAFSYGILLIPLLESFDSNRSVISNGGSLMFGFYLLSSPISGVLINKFGCRIVCIAGCVIGALGIGLSSLSPNVAVLMLTYGVVGGYGLGTMYLPSMVVISDYFEKKRGLATGMDLGKTLLADVNKLIVFKSLLTPSNILRLHLKQTLPPVI